MTETERAHKWLRPTLMGAYGHGDYSGYIPGGKRPGKWLPKVTDPVICRRGYHVTDLEHLLTHWALDATLYEVECRGAVALGADKSAWEQIRLVRVVGQATHPLMVTFACDCAERVPQGDAGRAAIAAAREWARCPCEEHRAAARVVGAAAWAADAASAGGAAAEEERRWQGERLLELLEGQA